MDNIGSSALIIVATEGGMVRGACDVMVAAGVVAVTAAAAVAVRAVRRRGEATHDHTCVQQCASSSPGNSDS